MHRGGPRLTLVAFNWRLTNSLRYTVSVNLLSKKSLDAMAKPTKKQLRAAEQIQIVLSELIQFEVADPRLQAVTVMSVQVDRELMYADVYVNSMEGEEARREVMAGLDKAAGFLRYNLGQQIEMRQVPELRFKWDETLERARQIGELIDSLDIPPEEPEDTSDADE